MNDENQLDEHMKGDKSGHDDHTPVFQTELPQTQEHGRRYNTTGACFTTQPHVGAVDTGAPKAPRLQTPKISIG